MDADPVRIEVRGQLTMTDARVGTGRVVGWHPWTHARSVKVIRATIGRKLSDP